MVATDSSHKEGLDRVSSIKDMTHVGYLGTYSGENEKSIA